MTFLSPADISTELATGVEDSDRCVLGECAVATGPTVDHAALAFRKQAWDWFHREAA